MKTWIIRSGKLHDIVQAPDQWAAWDTWKTKDTLDFGLIATAEPDEQGDDDTIPVKTSTLMIRWFRWDDAAAFHELARYRGLE